MILSKTELEKIINNVKNTDFIKNKENDVNYYFHLFWQVVNDIIYDENYVTPPIEDYTIMLNTIKDIIGNDCKYKSDLNRNTKDIIYESYTKLKKEFSYKISLLDTNLLEVLLYSKCLEHLAYTEIDIDEIKRQIQAINKHYINNNLLEIIKETIKQNEPF